MENNLSSDSSNQKVPLLNVKWARLLKIKRTASLREIREVWYRFSSLCHPDKVKTYTLDNKQVKRIQNYYFRCRTSFEYLTQQRIEENELAQLQQFEEILLSDDD